MAGASSRCASSHSHTPKFGREDVLFQLVCCKESKLFRKTLGLIVIHVARIVLFCKHWNNVIAIHVSAGQNSSTWDVAQGESTASVPCSPVPSLSAWWHEGARDLQVLITDRRRATRSCTTTHLPPPPLHCSPCLLPRTGWAPVISFVWILKMRWGKQIPVFWAAEGGCWKRQRKLAAAALLYFEAVFGKLDTGVMVEIT